MNQIEQKLKEVLDRMEDMSNKLNTINEKTGMLLEALAERRREDYDLKPKYEPKRGLTFYLSRKKQ